MQQLWYLYGFAPGRRSATPDIGGADWLTESGVSALVEQVDESDFGETYLAEHLKDIAWGTEKAERHHHVIARALETTLILPMKFGTVFQSPERIKSVIQASAEKLHELFKNCEHKLEVTLKLYYDKENVKKSLAAHSDVLKELSAELEQSSPGKQFILKKKIEQAEKDVLHREVNRQRQQLIEVFEDESGEYKQLKELSKQLTGRKDEMILNVAFLLEREQLDEFYRVVDNFRKELDQSGFSLEASAPWAPENFFKIEL
jgi:hypothetical protein